jgi:hypothetical protein
MASDRLQRVAWLVVGLGVLGSVIALINVWTVYGRSGVLDWGRVALAVAVPILLFAIMRSASARGRREPES